MGPRTVVSPLLAASLISALLFSLMVMFPISHVSAGSSNQPAASGSQNPPDVACNLYSPGLPQSTGSITITGVSLNGTTVSSILVDLRINGNNVSQGSLPVTFTGCQLGVQYGVVVYWYGNYYIRYINSSSGIDLQRYDLVNLSQSNPSVSLAAVFEYVPPSQATSLNFIAEFPNGTQLGTASTVNGYDLHSPGMWLTLTPPFQNTPYTGTFTGGSILPFTLFINETYTVQMSLGYVGPWITTLSGTGPMVNVTWSHWQDNNSTDPNRSITLNGSASYTAIYDQSPLTEQITTSTTSTPGSSGSSQTGSSTTTTSQSGSSAPTQTSTSTSPPPAPPPSSSSGSGGQGSTPNILTNLLGNSAVVALAAVIVIVIAIATALGVRHARK